MTERERLSEADAAATGRLPAAPGGDIVEGVLRAYRAAAAENCALSKVVGEKGGPAAERQAIADGLLYTSRISATGASYAMEGDPAYPMLEKMVSNTGKGFGLLNADCAYHITMLHGDYSYRLFGARGSARVYDASIYTTSMSDKAQAFVDSFSRKGVELAPNTEVDIRLSRTGEGPNWLKLPEGPCFLITRQYYYDWETETPAMLVIEREGAIYPPPTRTLDEITRRSEDWATFISSLTAFGLRSKYDTLKGEPNVLRSYGYATGDFRDIQYVNGYSVCREDQALIIEFKPPQTQYWSININDAMGNALHPHMRMASINGHSAAMDTDGVFRCVLSHHDTGVRNWLDTSGREVAVLNIRMHMPDEIPSVSVKVVPLKSVLGSLPKDTALVTPEERQAQLRARLASSYRRLMNDY